MAIQSHNKNIVQKIENGSEHDQSTANDSLNGLRPKFFNDYIGQNELKNNLRVIIDASKMRNEPLDHILFHGPPGLGKTTLAGVLASETGFGIKITSGPALEKQGDVASIISNLKHNDILFIDEIHRLKPAVEEILYTAMEDYGIDLVIGKGPSARSMRLKLPKFTLIAATTRLSMISSPLRDRFGAVFKLEFYSEDDICSIILRSAAILGVQIEDEASYLLAKSSRKTPRIANRLLKRVRDLAQVDNLKKIDSALVKKCLLLYGIDDLGLDKSDRDMLNIIIQKFDRGPVGLSTIAAATGEDKDTLESVYEPYLIQLGFLERTARGRIITDKAITHLHNTK